MYCASCGKELTPDAAYCIHCGARVPGPFRAFDRVETRWERRRQRGGRDGGSWWGIVNAIGFLIIVALTISQYPDVFALISRYLQSWGAYGYPVLPGRALGQVIIYILTVSGVWGLLSAGLRFAFTNSLSRPARDLVGALFALYMANSFSQFYSGAFGGTGLVFAFLIGLALVIIANALISFFVPHRMWTSRPR